MHRSIFLIISGLFFLFALVQFNDPDPLLWMLIYGSVALVALLKVYLKGVNLRPLILTLVVLFAVYAVLYIPSLIDYLGRPNKLDLVGKMKAETPWVEGSREFFGLLLSIGILFLILLKPLKK